MESRKHIKSTKFSLIVTPPSSSPRRGKADEREAQLDLFFAKGGKAQKHDRRPWPLCPGKHRLTRDRRGKGRVRPHPCTTRSGRQGAWSVGDPDYRRPVHWTNGVSWPTPSQGASRALRQNYGRRVAHRVCERRRRGALCRRSAARNGRPKRRCAH